MHEVELRGRLSKDAYLHLKQRLDRLATGKRNDKKSQFFVFQRGILKVSEHKQAKKTILSLKLGDETRNSLEELEVTLSPGMFTPAVNLLEKLGYTRRELVEQLRIDYEIDDISIAIKYTPDWGYHFEVEKMSKSSMSDQQRTREDLLSFCQTLNIYPMTEEELARFLVSIKR